MSKRLFIVQNITKTAQKNTPTKFDESKVYSGTPSAAAKKAFYDACKKMGKRIRNACTLSVVVAEVKKVSVYGVTKYVPVKDSLGEIKYKYALKLMKYDTPKIVQFGDKEIKFVYYPVIVNSLGRV